MRALSLCAALALAVVIPVTAAQQSATAAAGQGYTLTVIVEAVNNLGGNVGMLVFNSPKGWAEDRSAALKDISVPAHEGTVTITVPDLPAGEYAIALVHDVNKNHKLDRNWIGEPKEQWGLSNNPHAVIKTPSYKSCTFELKGNQEIHIKMQQ
jgi:uncharacterized protein (DUF2141 family)